MTQKWHIRTVSVESASHGLQGIHEKRIERSKRSRNDRRRPVTTRTSLPERRTRTRSYLIAALRLLRRWRTHRAARRTIDTLHHLSDFTLNDIGLCRDQISRRFGP
jgi:uncharacterized protein YjiS (DUF1127 family)